MFRLITSATYSKIGGSVGIVYDYKRRPIKGRLFCFVLARTTYRFAEILSVIHVTLASAINKLVAIPSRLVVSSYHDSAVSSMPFASLPKAVTITR